MLVDGDLSYAGISVITVLSAGIGAFIGAYLKKKGENLATHEDFQTVLTELKETTRTTKEIENKISDAVWDRQKRWEMKRDTMIDIATKAATAKDTLVKLHAIHLPAKNAEAGESPATVAKQIELNDAWNTASNDLSRMVVIASLACGAEVRTTLADFAMFTSDLSVEIVGGHPEVLVTRSDDFATKYNAITKAMRKEIGNGSEPMFLTDVSFGAGCPGSLV
jgi:hypothetical protein